MARQNPSVISTRLTDSHLAAVKQLASDQGLSLSAFARKAIAILSNAPPDDTSATRRNVAAALGLKPDASDDEILQAVEALLDADADLEPADGDALQADPETPPPAAGGQVVQTSRGAVRLSASEIETCKELGAKLEDYALNKATRDAARPHHPPGVARATATGAPHRGKVVTLSNGASVTLTDSEIKACADMGAKLEDYALNKSVRDAARRRR